MEIVRLIERCRQGEADALGELYETYAGRMRGVCQRYVSDRQAVDDVLHDAFLIIFTSLDRLRDASKAESWMMAIVHHVASKYKARMSVLPTVPLDEAAVVEATGAEQDVRDLPIERMLQMVERLPEGYAKVFRLSVFEGMSHKEIAAMLGIEPHSSSSQLVRAKKLIRRMIRQYWAAVLLLLLAPVTFFLLRKGDVATEEGTVATAKHHLPQPAPRATVARNDTPQSVTTQRAAVITTDTLGNRTVQEPMAEDTTARDTAGTIPPLDGPHGDRDSRLPAPSVTRPDRQPRWSVELAYSGITREYRQNDQPYRFYRYTDPNRQASSISGEHPTYVVPSSIDRWSDYATYLANNPDAVSEKVRSAILRIALNNAGLPDGDKIRRTSRHRMPVTWSLAFRYRLTDRLGLESGLSYSRLGSDFETGGEGNVICEQQTIHYVGIPLKGVYTMYDARPWSLYGSLGLTTEIPVHAVLRSDYYVNGQHAADDKAQLRAPLQFSTTFGLGLQYHLTPDVGLFAEPSLHYSLPTGSAVETYRTEHPLTFSLPLGIRFTW